ncbi:MAG: hypothetical protein ACHQQQ_08930 [Bacteroidota bacterium]
MKNLIILILVLCCLPAAFGQATKSLDLKFPRYTLVVPLQPMSYGKDNNLVPIVAAGKDTKMSATDFGIIYRLDGKSPSAISILDILDAENNSTIKSVSLDEYFGKENGSWKFDGDASNSNKTKVTSVFTFPYKGSDYRFIRTVEVKKEAALPMGKSIVVSFSIRSESSIKLKAVFRGEVLGTISGENGLYSLISNDSLIAGNPTMLLRTTPNLPVKIENDGKSFTISSSEMAISPKTQADMMSLSFTGTSVGFSDHTAKQVENLSAYFLQKKTAPDMKSVTVANKTSVLPGDTITYSIYNYNIGTAPAADISINNPISNGASYVNGSASGEGTDISYTRDNSAAGKAGSVTSITWKFKTVISPGEERIVKFKAVAR